MAIRRTKTIPPVGIALSELTRDDTSDMHERYCINELTYHCCFITTWEESVCEHNHDEDPAWSYHPSYVFQSN